MGEPKVVSMSARPMNSAYLCFEVSGVIGEWNIGLGDDVPLFDFAGTYAILAANPTVSNGGDRLLYDSSEIQALTKPFTLSALRAESAKATLNKAINARQNAYYAKYANANDIVGRIRNLYLEDGAKPSSLRALQEICENQKVQIEEAYRSDGRTGVVKSTSSSLDSTQGSGGDSSRTERTKTITAPFYSRQIDFPPSPPEEPQFIPYERPMKADFQSSISTDGSTTSSSASQHEAIENTDYAYRIPYLENLAQYHRARISLIDEQFNQFINSQNIEWLTLVFRNELASIDADVFQVQMAYLNTILMSPISGTVTGVYKNPGEAVSAGEPVVRVENNTNIWLVADLIYRGPFPVNAQVEVQTKLFDSTGPSTTIRGDIATARNKGDDERWEVVIGCSNFNGSDTKTPVLPLGYCFDHDNTTISFV
jgi:biotin carboxyl carrier protein